jgi:hypothetical protein
MGTRFENIGWEADSSTDEAFAAAERAQAGPRICDRLRAGTNRAECKPRLVAGANELTCCGHNKVLNCFSADGQNGSDTRCWRRELLRARPGDGRGEWGSTFTLPSEGVVANIMNGPEGTSG